MADTTQQLEDDDCITPRQSTTITLQYPSLPVTGTPDSWLSNSLLVSMASNQDEGSVRSNDDTMSSLGDSAYDFIDDNSFAATDDEESALTEHASLADKSAREAPVNQDLERTLSADNVHHHSSDSLAQDGMQNPMCTSSSGEDILCHDPSPEPLQQQATNQQGLPSIRFKEIHHGEGVFLLESASAPQGFAVSVRQHLLDQNLSLEGPYRLLYTGDVAARERIVAKIGAALASTPTEKNEASQPLRYNVVPMPSSDDPAYWSEPVLLDWSGHEIVVHQCVNASFDRKEIGHDTIELTLDGNTHVRSSWNGTRFVVTEGWEVPDIAIFYLSDRDSVSAKQTRRFARSFVARHKIPTFVISEKPSWDRPSEAMTIERLTPHVCLQTESSIASMPRVVKRLPIDLATFTRLDAAQLNQNLAYFALESGTHQSKQDKRNMQSGGRQLNSDPSPFIWNVLRKYLGTAAPGSSYLLGLLAAASIYVACSFIVAQLTTVPVSSIDHILNPHTTYSSALTSMSSAVATSMASLNVKPTTPQSLIIPDPTRVLTSQRLSARKPHTGLATLLESTPMTINKSEKFQVNVLGDAHIVLRPPYWFTRLRRSPKLNINVTQDGRVLKHQLSILFDGVYALDLPNDEAHGLINIAVWTLSKPKIHENLQIDFGNSWLYVNGWKKAVNALSDSLRQDLDLVQTSLSAIYTRSGGELHSLMQTMLGKAEKLNVETRTIGKASMSRMVGTTDRMLASTKNISLKISRFLKQQKDSACKEVTLEAEKWRRQISSYVCGKAHVARVYVGAAPTAYRIHLRHTQKRALKIWWSMTGLPQQRPVSVAAKGRSRTSSG
ncbi:MAG: hypothetical protein Q9166_000536 [cf. Caloplaca sp. 2 TL-2023]